MVNPESRGLHNIYYPINQVGIYYDVYFVEGFKSRKNQRIGKQLCTYPNNLSWVAGNSKSPGRRSGDVNRSTCHGDIH